MLELSSEKCKRFRVKSDNNIFNHRSLVGLTFVHENIYRIMNGVYDCENICSFENVANELTNCGVSNFTSTLSEGNQSKFLNFSA